MSERVRYSDREHISKLVRDFIVDGANFVVLGERSPEEHLRSAIEAWSRVGLARRVNSELTNNELSFLANPGLYRKVIQTYELTSEGRCILEYLHKTDPSILSLAA